MFVFKVDIFRHWLQAIVSLETQALLVPFQETACRISQYKWPWSDVSLNKNAWGKAAGTACSSKNCACIFPYKAIWPHHLTLACSKNTFMCAVLLCKIWKLCLWEILMTRVPWLCKGGGQLFCPSCYHQCTRESLRLLLDGFTSRSLGTLRELFKNLWLWPSTVPYTVGQRLCHRKPRWMLGATTMSAIRLTKVRSRRNKESWHHSCCPRFIGKSNV